MKYGLSRAIKLTLQVVIPGLIASSIMKKRNLLLSTGLAFGLVLSVGANAGTVNVDLFDGSQAVGDYSDLGSMLWATEYSGESARW